MANGLFDDYAVIVDRIAAQVPDFAIVGSPSTVFAEDDILTRLPGCYVMPGESSPAETGNRQQLRMEDQTWQILLVVGYLAGNDAPEIELGRLALGVIDALHAWQSPDLRGWLDYNRRGRIQYDEGFAMLELTFSRRNLITR